MSSLRDAFLANHRRLLDAGLDEVGPPVEESRKVGFGVRIPAFCEAVRRNADLLVAEGGREPRVPTVLASAFAGTGDERYAAAARESYEAWVQACPPASFTAGMTCDLAHGLYAWLAALHAFLNSPAFDDGLVEAIVGTARAQLDHIAGNLYRARNLRITTASSLLLNGLRGAFLPEAHAWIEKGVSAMRDACHRQIMPDGSHMEAVPHYHFCTMGDILSVVRAGRALPELGWNVPAEHIAGLYDYLAAATRPGGWIAGIGDGTYEPSSGVRGRGVADVLQERAAYRRWLGLPDRELPARLLFPHAGQAFLRDSWSADATYVTFDASPCRSYHWHPSRNAIQLEAQGRLLLADPGRFSYSDAAWGSYGMSTPAHSTLNLNGWNQCEAPAEVLHRCAEGYDVVAGYYAGGYWTGNVRSNNHGEGVYAEHHRTLLWVHGRCIVVIDDLFNASPADQKPTLESVWQLSEGEVEVDTERGTALTKHGDADLLMIFALRPAAATLRVRAGEEHPLRGWAPKLFEQQYVPAPQVCLSAVGHDPWHTDLATVLVPHRGAAPDVAVTATVDPGRAGDFYHPSPGMIALRWGDGSTDEIWWMRRLAKALNEAPGFATDAALVHLQRDAGGRLARGLVMDGTHVKPFQPRPFAEQRTFTIGGQP